MRVGCFLPQRATAGRCFWARTLPAHLSLNKQGVERISAKYQIHQLGPLVTQGCTIDLIAEICMKGLEIRNLRSFLSFCLNKATTSPQASLLERNQNKATARFSQRLLKFTGKGGEVSSTTQITFLAHQRTRFRTWFKMICSTLCKESGYHRQQEAQSNLSTFKSAHQGSLPWLPPKITYTNTYSCKFPQLPLCVSFMIRFARSAQQTQTCSRLALFAPKPSAPSSF